MSWILCNRGCHQGEMGEARDSENQASLLLQRQLFPPGEGNTQRPYPEAHLSPEPLPFRHLGERSLPRRITSHELCRKNTRSFPPCFQSSLTMEATESLLKIPEWSSAITGHWICIPELYCLGSCGMIKPLHLEFPCTHVRTMPPFHR